ncbi:hypothetical protein [Granulicella pectinivorans]|uniref:hypothetical protein n=1 Tax=Granulicella pectinivorans TaxID=474950 RepID=UPI00113FE31B|nr:hypothetical protein [Granulicella pectinivorans]
MARGWSATCSGLHEDVASAVCWLNQYPWVGSQWDEFPRCSLDENLPGTGDEASRYSGQSSYVPPLKGELLMSDPISDLTSNAEDPFRPTALASSSLPDSLDEEIVLLEGGRFRWLGQSPVLEEKFEASSSAQRSRRMWIEGICCVLLYNCFLISDSILFPGTFLPFLAVRLGVATPPAIVVPLWGRRVCRCAA